MAATAVDITTLFWHFIEAIEAEGDEAGGMGGARDCPAFHRICGLVGEGRRFLLKLPTSKTTAIIDEGDSGSDREHAYLVSDEPEDLFVAYAQALRDAGQVQAADRVGRAEKKIRAFLHIQEMLEGDGDNGDNEGLTRALEMSRLCS